MIVFECWPKRKPEVTKSCRIPGKSVRPLSDVSAIGVAGGVQRKARADLRRPDSCEHGQGMAHKNPESSSGELKPAKGGPEPA